MTVRKQEDLQDETVGLSADLPSMHVLPEDATPTQIARAYGTLAAFFAHQWPALILELKYIRRRLDRIEHLSPRVRWELLVLIVVVSIFGAFVLGVFMLGRARVG